MKKLTNAGLILVAIMLLLPVCCRALALTPIEIKLMNDISRFIDAKPEGQALRFFEHAIKSDSVALKGLASLILVKHYGRRFQALFLRNFTLNQANDNFAQDRKVLVKLANINRLLTGFDTSLLQLNDERVRRLFLFFHFRHKNVWMLGETGEELSLAVFYRISIFNSFFDEKVDVTRLAMQADVKK